MTAAATLIVEQSVIEPLGGSPTNLVVVPRRRPLWRRHRQTWAPLNPDTVLDVLAAAPRPAVALVRTPEADPGATVLLDVARLLGLEVRCLPDDVEAAAWSVSVASRANARIVVGGRTLDALCSAPPSPQERSGCLSESLRASSLGRWATRAWRPCGWCSAGGFAGERCARCGSTLTDERP